MAMPSLDPSGAVQPHVQTLGLENPYQPGAPPGDGSSASPVATLLAKHQRDLVLLFGANLMQLRSP